VGSQRTGRRVIMEQIFSNGTPTTPKKCIRATRQKHLHPSDKRDVRRKPTLQNSCAGRNEQKRPEFQVLRGNRIYTTGNDYERDKKKKGGTIKVCGFARKSCGREKKPRTMGKTHGGDWNTGATGVWGGKKNKLGRENMTANHIDEQGRDMGKTSVRKNPVDQ